MSAESSETVRTGRRARIVRALTAALAAAVVLCGAPAAQAARKALVIGNDNYVAIEKLRNARADADAMAAALRKAGYVVTLEKDRTLRQMKDAVRTFRAGIGGGDEVVVFYSGHGLQLGGMNYLLPIDVRAQVEDQVRDDSLALGDLLFDIGRQKPALTLAIIDACRNNPFAKAGRAIGGRGLTGVAGATGQMVIYSAGEGQEALDRLGDSDPVRNGVFTRVFIREMETPGASIHDVVQSVREKVHRLAENVRHEQVPAIYDQVLGRFYFYAVNSTIVVNPSLSPAASTATMDPAALELAFWNSIAASKDPQEFAAYLEQYPDGKFAALAKIKQKLQVQEPATPPAIASRPKYTVVVLSGEAAGEAIAKTYFGGDVVLNRFNLRALIEKEVLDLLRSVFHDVRADSGADSGDATRVRIAVSDIVFRNNSYGDGFDATGKLEISVSSTPGSAKVERTFDLSVRGKDTVPLFFRSHTTVSRDMLDQLPDLLKREILIKAKGMLDQSEVRSIATAAAR